MMARWEMDLSPGRVNWPRNGFRAMLVNVSSAVDAAGSVSLFGGNGCMVAESASQKLVFFQDAVPGALGTREDAIECITVACLYLLGQGVQITLEAR